MANKAASKDKVASKAKAASKDKLAKKYKLAPKTKVPTKHKLKDKIVRKKPDESQENLSCKDVNRVDEVISTELATSLDSRSQSSPQRSNSRLSFISRSNSGSISPRSPCSTKLSTPTRSNRSISSKSHCSSRQHSIHSRSRSATRSNSRSRSRSGSWSSTPERLTRLSAASSSHSPQRSHHSKSRSRSRSNTSYRSTTARRSLSPISDNATRVSAHSSSLHFVQLQLKELAIIAKQNYHRIAVNDRRLARMEVSVNKVLVMKKHANRRYFDSWYFK